MGITRRQFLFSIPAAGAGFILPSFFDKAVDVLARTGEPLLIPPEECVTELLAIYQFSGDYQLNIGDNSKEPPSMTWREYILEFSDEDPEEYVLGAYGDSDAIDLDAEADWWDVLDSWAGKYSSNARAYHLLDGLDLGPVRSASNCAGELRFINGACPGVDYLGVHAADELTLSLLQHRLNQLKTGIHIKVF